ncbi:DUF4192 domain-containing protein [Nocardioides pelophilus]|uniref:DUF4192 domain-containing protein n=1 Tax=Nocardioides pelophilus TaxID=2172019 RepID=UPI0015FF5D97|nr:DUF4192 domain-containing protein [Nocardioides pelophilus]
MTDTRTIRSHDELISYIRHLMGFHPESSLVCVSVGGGPHSRIDLPHSPEGMEQLLQQLSDVYLHRHPVRRLALVAYGEKGYDCLEALTSLSATLNYGGGGPEIGPMLWVKGDQWYDVLNDSRGTVDPVVRDRVDAEFALMGRAIPTGRREDLAAAMQGDPSGVAEHLVAAEARVLDMDTSANVAEVRWLRSCLDGFLETGKYLEDDAAARVLAIIHDSGARDAAVFRMSRENAPAFSDFWQDLVRRAPEEVRDSPATMLALSSFLDGKGAKAWTALDQMTEGDRLADMVATALEQAIDPAVWDKAAPVAAQALMQHAALRDTTAHERSSHDHRRRGPGIEETGPASSAPGR